MLPRKFGGSALLVGALLALAPFAASPATAAPRNSAAAQAHPTTYPGALDADAVVLPVVTEAASCSPYVDGDNVHVSSGDVSGHGWWYQGTCGNVKTTVYIYLYEYYSDGTWRSKNSGSKNVYPGGGSANRAATRIACTSVVPAAWRTLVVVHIGTGASAYTKTLNLPCRNG